jgi:endonuclease YncB( thermonuclease family)
MQLIAIALLLAPALAWAATLEGHVIGVPDGDTIRIVNAKHQQLRVRIAGIDAPERGQPFSKRSQENLNKLVRRKLVVVEWHKKDRYGRLVGTVYVRGHDVGLDQVRAGLAWWYREYAKEQPPDEREVYEVAERAAKERKLGLWADPQPMPPWEWRQGGRPN